MKLVELKRLAGISGRCKGSKTQRFFGHRQQDKEAKTKHKDKKVERNAASTENRKPILDEN